MVGPFDAITFGSQIHILRVGSVSSPSPNKTGFDALLEFLWMTCSEEEVFDTTLEVKRDSHFGAWCVGTMRFKERQVTQMTNYEIMVDVEHCKHESS